MERDIIVQLDYFLNRCFYQNTYVLENESFLKFFKCVKFCLKYEMLTATLKFMVWL